MKWRTLPGSVQSSRASPQPIATSNLLLMLLLPHDGPLPLLHWINSYFSHLSENLSVVDSDDGSGHLWHDHHVPQVSLHLEQEMNRMQSIVRWQKI